MAWFCLVVAGCMEIVWFTLLKQSDGFTKPWHGALALLASLTSLVLVGWALRTLPLGLSYAVWTGIGTVGSAAVGMLYFSESSNPLRLLYIALILAGIVGLKWTSTGVTD